MRSPARARDQLAGAAAAGALFVVLARAVVRDEPTAFDRAVHDAAERAYSRWLEVALSPIEVLGLPGFYIPLALLIARRLRRRRAFRAGRTVIAASVAGWAALRTSRVFYARVRPPRPAHRAPKSERSFPSGHTTGLTSLAIAAALVLQHEGVLTRLEALALGVGVPLATGFDRAYVREHWATDALGGWLLGGAVALGTVGAAGAAHSRSPRLARRRPRT